MTLIVEGLLLGVGALTGIAVVNCTLATCAVLIATCIKK